jgi:hypothetical protein
MTLLAKKNQKPSSFVTHTLRGVGSVICLLGYQAENTIEESFLRTKSDLDGMMLSASELSLVCTRPDRRKDASKRPFLTVVWGIVGLSCAKMQAQIGSVKIQKVIDKSENWA